MSVSNLTREEWALRLAQLGFNIFPLSRGSKSPVQGVAWSEIMTTNEVTIKQWFISYPDMNYGVCGGQNGVIIDVDNKEGKHGNDEISRLESLQDFNSIISIGGFIVRTPSNGFHYYLRTPYPVSNASRFAKGGIDIRGVRGYTVGPASELLPGLCKSTDTTGFYENINNEEPLNAPAWILANLKQQGERDVLANDEPVGEVDTPAAIQRAIEFLKLCEPTGTYRTACSVMDFGISKTKTLELILEYWNQRRAQPRTEEEISDRINHAVKYRQEQIGSRSAPLMDVLDKQTGVKVTESKDDKWARLREHTFPAGTIFKRGKLRDMVIPEWMPGHGMIAILAKRGAGKTVTMLDMALRISLDMDWHGMPVRKGYYVVYICGEDDEGAEEQIRAWCIAHQQNEPSARFIFLDIITDLLSDNDVREWAEFLKDTIGFDNRAVTFVDTWQRATASGGQNKDEDMQKAVHYAEAIGRSLGGPIIVAAHPSKANEDLVLGSSVIENSTTAIWKLAEHAHGRKLEVTRIKGKGYGNYQLFKFMEQKLGQLDEFGRARTGIFPIKVGGIEFDKNTEAQIDLERSAYAEVIAAIDIDRLDPVYGDGDPKPYSLTKMADKISLLPKEAEEIDSEGKQTPRAKWAMDMINLLKTEANVMTWGDKTISNRLSEIFMNLPMGHPTKNDFRLRLKQDGKAYRFVIEKMLIDRAGKNI